MQCPKCGKEIADGSKFCEFCGTRVVPPSTEHNRPGRLTTTHLVLIVVAAIISLAAVLIAVLYRPTPSPSPSPVLSPSSPQKSEVVTRTTEVETPQKKVEYENEPIEVVRTESTAQKLDMIGTAAEYSCAIQFDLKTGYGEYSQYLGNGESVIRTLRLREYNGNTLVLDAYNPKGQYVSQFRGTLSNYGNRYSGTITNTKGYSISFDVSQ